MNGLTKIFILFVFIAVSFMLFAFYGAFKKMRIEPVSFPQHSIVIKAEVAENSYQLAKGLMFRESLNENNGMLFIFNNEGNRTFWMKNTKIPLDLIFISKNKKIVDIKENFLPCSKNSCPSYTSTQPAKYVLEVNAGFVEKNKIQIDEEISF